MEVCGFMCKGDIETVTMACLLNQEHEKHIYIYIFIFIPISISILCISK